MAWNFEKFLVGRDGTVIARYKSGVAPDSAELLAPSKLLSMPAEPVAQFGELLAQTPADAGGLDQLIADLTAQEPGETPSAAHDCSGDQRDTAASIKAELTNQLCLGNETRVRSCWRVTARTHD